MIAIIIFIWRLCLFAVGMIGATRNTYAPTFPYSDIYLIPSHLPQWIWSWANFDGVHYLSIARYSYAAQYTQAFFPVYPLLIRAVKLVLSDQFGIISGLLISWIAFVSAVFFLRKLLELDYKKSIVHLTLMFLLIFPTSFFFAALYTESLFFLEVVLAFWLARKRRWWLSAFIVALSTSTRITGIVLIPVLLWEWYVDVYRPKLNIYSKIRGKQLFLNVWNLLLDFIWRSIRSPYIYIGPIGLLAYMIFLQFKYGDGLYFWHAQSVFGASRAGSSFVFPLQVVWRYCKILLSQSSHTEGFWIAVWELGSLVITSTLLLIGHKLKIRVSYLLFGWLTELLPILTGTLSSLPRYVVIIFPIYIVLASFSGKKLKLIIVCISRGIIF